MRDITSRFVLAQLEDAGVLPLAEKILAKSELTLNEAQQLASVTLPLLGKLVELKCDPPALNPKQFVHRVICLPAAALLEEHGYADALAAARCWLDTRLIQPPAFQRLYLAVDRWRGTFSALEMLELLKKAVASDRWASMILLGPSSDIIRIWLEETNRTNNLDLSSLLVQLREAGIVALEGGSDLGIHRAAADAGLMIAVSQVVTDSTTFLSAIFCAREMLAHTGRFTAWYPELSGPLDGSSLADGEASGLEVMRAIALARLVLPVEVTIRAPLVSMGEKMARVALDFGAADLGFMGADAESAALLKIPDPNDLADLFENCETPLISIDKKSQSIKP
ncbi:MAG TPA: hypothetical protein VIH42_07565 [Thermoguttaceae bacterium]